MLYASTKSFYAEVEVLFCKIDGVLSLQIYDFFYKKKVNEDRKIFFFFSTQEIDSARRRLWL